MIFEPFWAFFPVGQMDSAPSQNDRYIHYISAIRDGLLPVTAELIEMAQYYIYATYTRTRRHTWLLSCWAFGGLRWVFWVAWPQV